MMTRNGSTIIVDAEEMPGQLTALLQAVESEGYSVEIQREGRPVATLQPAQQQPSVNPLEVHPELKALHVADDAFAPLDEQDWPEEYR